MRFTRFDLGMSARAQVRVRAELRGIMTHLPVEFGIEQVAAFVNAKLRGWITTGNLHLPTTGSSGTGLIIGWSNVRGGNASASKEDGELLLLPVGFDSSAIGLESICSLVRVGSMTILRRAV